MRRRTFLLRCSLLATGSVFAPALLFPHSQLWAAGVSAQSSTQMTPGDRALLRLLSAYNTDAYFWGSQVFARATGFKMAAGTTNLLVRFDDHARLTAFLGSGTVKTLGIMRAAGNTLSFTFQGAAYTVTNEKSERFTQAVAAGGVARDHLTAVGVFAHESMLYHPATDTLHDPHLAAENKKLDLAEMPVGGVSPKMQTLLQGWLKARQQGLGFGASFQRFQDDLLQSEPTAKAAPKVVAALLENLSALAGQYRVEELGPLLLSPLISASLQAVLGIDATKAVADARAMRDEASTRAYPDAAVWLAVLLPAQIEAGTAEEWLNPTGVDEIADAANRAALPLAKQLVGLSVPTDR